MNNTLGDNLLNNLNDLRLKLNKTDLEELLSLLIKTKDRLNTSGVERTVGLRDNIGSDCAFYSKSLDLFLKKDYLDFKGLVEELHRLFEGIG